MKWSVTYESARKEDGTLFFPEKLSEEKLSEYRQSQGIYKFTNQYLNQIIPEDSQDFKRAWLKYYEHIPAHHLTFCFIDPAISLNDGADYTATTIVHVDSNKTWYLSHAFRQRITATQTIEWIFKIYDQFKPAVIGIEDVAYQKALLHVVSEEMFKRNKILPLKGIPRSRINTDGDKRSNNSKPMRIRSLVPRFEFGKILINQGLDDFILEYSQFPRGSHDDLLDALSSIEDIVYYPNELKEDFKNVRSPHDPRYESKVIRDLVKRANQETSGTEE